MALDHQKIQSHFYACVIKRIGIMRRQSLQKQSLPIFFVAFEYQASDKAR